MTLPCFPSPRALQPRSRPAQWNCNALATRRSSSGSSESVGRGGSTDGFDFGWQMEQSAAEGGGEEVSSADMSLDFYASAAMPLGIDPRELDAMKVHYNPACATEEDSAHHGLRAWQRGGRRGTVRREVATQMNAAKRVRALPRLTVFFSTSL